MSGYAARPNPSSTARTCDARRRGGDSTAAQADRKILAPGLNAAPAGVLHGSCRGAWSLPPNRRTGCLVCVQPGAGCVG